MSIPYNYDEAQALLGDILREFEVMSGDSVGLSNMTWQDYCNSTAGHLRTLSDRLYSAVEGNVTNGPVVFPSPNDLENGQW